MNQRNQKPECNHQFLIYDSEKKNNNARKLGECYHCNSTLIITDKYEKVIDGIYKLKDSLEEKL